MGTKTRYNEKKVAAVHWAWYLEDSQTVLTPKYRMPPTVPGAPAALVIAHPGHELRVHGWLELTRPKVFILTDGSGRSGRSRLASTTRILSQVGAEPGPIYGRLTDLMFYSAVLNHDPNVFINLAEELAEAFIQAEVQYVAGDATEGYNPAHDICRLLIDTAVEMANWRSRRRIANFDFLLAGPPHACPTDLRADAICLQLQDDAFERKLRTARNYPELVSEVDNTLCTTGIEAFRVECLRPANTRGSNRLHEPLFYESYGEKQVAAGYYKQVLRYREHVVPLTKALWHYVGQGAR